MYINHKNLILNKSNKGGKTPLNFNGLLKNQNKLPYYNKIKYKKTELIKKTFEFNIYNIEDFNKFNIFLNHLINNKNLKYNQKALKKEKDTFIIKEENLLICLEDFLMDLNLSCSFYDYTMIKCKLTISKNNLYLTQNFISKIITEESNKIYNKSLIKSLYGFKDILGYGEFLNILRINEYNYWNDSYKSVLNFIKKTNENK